MKKTLLILIIGMLSTLQAFSQSLHESYEAADQYDSLRLRSVNEGVLYECGGVTYNFLEGFVFFYDYDGNPPGSHIPKKPYVLNKDLVTWYWKQEEIFNKDGVLYRDPAKKAELNFKAKTLVYEDMGIRYLNRIARILILQQMFGREKTRLPNELIRKKIFSQAGTMILVGAM